MRHHIFTESANYLIAVLAKGTSFNKQELINNYIAPLEECGVPQKDIIAFTLNYNEQNKAPNKFIKEYLDELLPVLESLGVKYLYVADANYFKVMTGQGRADPHFGYLLPCKQAGFEHMTVVLGLNYQQLIFNPDLQAKLDLSLKTLSSAINGSYKTLGSGIIHSAHYPTGLQAISDALDSLHQYPALTSDIEAFSLRFNEAGIGTIAFAWDQHNGMAFACDYAPVGMPELDPILHGLYKPDPEVRALIKNFLDTYQGELTWHNAAYDAKVLIYVLWMADLLDTAGLLKGLEVMTKAIQDTKIIAYLATNSTAGNILALKALAHEYAGNWAVEVKDIRKVPLPKLLEYNLIDALSTRYVKDKFYPIMVQDKQEDLYKTLMLPSLKLILQIELTGMPLNADKVQDVRHKLETIEAEHLDTITNSPHVQSLNLMLQVSAMELANSKLKVKQHPLSKFLDLVMNPNSGPQLQRLIYEHMQLPVIDLTDTKQPATGSETLEKLINHTETATYKELLSALIGYTKVNKILSTFIPAFERAILKGDGIVWLHGSFNLGGTVSGRLSSSDPNLQNIPSGSVYAKLIKECFIAPPGWLFCGADYNSLEDMISALTTRDPNKLGVYERGYDGHCLRAYAYFKHELPEIRQAEDTERCFSITVAGKTVVGKQGDFIVSTDGTRTPIEIFYETYQRL